MFKKKKEKNSMGKNKRVNNNLVLQTSYTLLLENRDLKFLS